MKARYIVTEVGQILQLGQQFSSERFAWVEQRCLARFPASIHPHTSIGAANAAELCIAFSQLLTHFDSLPLIAQARNDGGMPAPVCIDRTFNDEITALLQGRIIFVFLYNYNDYFCTFLRL